LFSFVYDRNGQDRRLTMTNWTLAAIKANNLVLEAYCQAKDCKHFFVFDLDQLIAIVGPDYSVPEIIPNMACTECGGQLKTALAMMPPAEKDKAPRID
jgi:hypothetical protein